MPRDRRLLPRTSALLAAILAAAIIVTPSSAAAQPSAPGTVLLADNFDDAINGKLPVAAAQPGRADRGYVEGEYMIRKTDPGMEISPISILPDAYADSTLAVDARIVGPTEGRTVSIACRSDAESDSQYRLTVRPDIGHFDLIRWDDGRRVPLLEWQPSAVIQPGNAVNRLQLTCAGPTIAAGINGALVGLAEDATYGSGRLWIGAGDLLSLELTVDARFDNLVVTQP